MSLKLKNGNYYLRSIYYVSRPAWNALNTSISFKHQTTLWAKYFYLILQRRLSFRKVNSCYMSEQKFNFSSICQKSGTSLRKKKIHERHYKVVSNGVSTVDLSLHLTVGYVNLVKFLCVCLCISSLRNGDKSGTHPMELLLGWGEITHMCKAISAVPVT